MARRSAHLSHVRWEVRQQIAKGAMVGADTKLENVNQEISQNICLCPQTWIRKAPATDSTPGRRPFTLPNIFQSREYQRALDSQKGENFVIWSHFHHLSTSGAGVSEKTLCRHESWSTRALGELLMTLVNWRFKKREHLVQSKFCLQIRRNASELERKRCFAPVSTSPW